MRSPVHDVKQECSLASIDGSKVDAPVQVCHHWLMDARDTILTHLKTAYDLAGRSKARLIRDLGLPANQRMSLSRALDSDEPTVPYGDIMCQWIDALGLKLVKPAAAKPAGAGAVREVRLMAPSDLALPPEDWPDRGAMTLPAADLDTRDLDSLALGAVTVRRGMPPTILPGDTVIVDASDGAKLDMVDGAVHVVDLGGLPQLRRIQRGATGWILASDTPGIVPIDIPHGASWPCDVLGRVVAVLHYE